MRMRMMASAVLVLLVLVGSVGAAQAPSIDQALPTDPALTTGTLPNGLAYIIRPHRIREGRVSVWLHVASGSLNETECDPGARSLSEHMAFNGSTHFPPGSVVPFFQSLGLSFGRDQNAFTSSTRPSISSAARHQARDLDKGMPSSPTSSPSLPCWPRRSKPSGRSSSRNAAPGPGSSSGSATTSGGAAGPRVDPGPASAHWRRSDHPVRDPAGFRGLLRALVRAEQHDDHRGGGPRSPVAADAIKKHSAPRRPSPAPRRSTSESRPRAGRAPSWPLIPS